MGKSLDAYVAELPKERQERLEKRTQVLFDEHHAPDFGRFMIETVLILGGAILLGLIVLTAFPNVYITALVLSVVMAMGYVTGVANTKWPYRKNGND